MQLVTTHKPVRYVFVIWLLTDYCQWCFLMSQNLSRLWTSWNIFVCAMKRSNHRYSMLLELWIQMCLIYDLRLQIADTHKFRISSILPISKWSCKTQFTAELNIRYICTVYQFSNRYDAGYYKFSVNQTTANIMMPSWLDEARTFISLGPLFTRSREVSKPQDSGLNFSHRSEI